MARLSYKARKRLKKSDFALPGKKGSKGKGAYPVEDKKHARDALARESEELAKGHLSPEQAATIKHKAYHVLGESDSAYHNKGWCVTGIKNLVGDPGESYASKIARYYGVAGDTAYPAPGSAGPAQMLYQNHVTYQTANNQPVVEGSDSWPGSTNPTTAKVVR